MGLFGFGKKKAACELLATQSGEITRLEDLGDGVFSEKMLGDGFVIQPEEGAIYSPVSGTVSNVADTLHAYGITTADGLDILVHIGVDTVALKGEGFKALVREGQKIKAGDKIAEADLDFIRLKNLPVSTVVLITNIDDVKSVSVNYGKCSAAETVALTYVK